METVTFWIVGCYVVLSSSMCYSMSGSQTWGQAAENVDIKQTVQMMIYIYFNGKCKLSLIKPVGWIWEKKCLMM